MTTGSVLGTLMLAGLSQVQTLLALYAVWIGIGAVGAMVLYEAAFATVIAWAPARRRAGALLAVTVVAGFASTIFVPLIGMLVDRYCWPAATVILAGVHGLLTVPLHAAVLRPTRPLSRRGFRRTGRGSSRPPGTRIVPTPRSADLRRLLRWCIRPGRDYRAQ